MKTRIRQRKASSGYITIEILLAFMILLIASLAVIQYGIAMVVKPNIVHAATVAAREAAKGADEEEVEEVINTVLQPHGIQIGAGASMVLEVMGETFEAGDIACPPPSTPELDPDEARVTICVDMGAQPFLNILPTYGIDFANKKMKSYASARLE